MLLYITIHGFKRLVIGSVVGATKVKANLKLRNK